MLSCCLLFHELTFASNTAATRHEGHAYLEQRLATTGWNMNSMQEAALTSRHRASPSKMRLTELYWLCISSSTANKCDSIQEEDPALGRNLCYLSLFHLPILFPEYRKLRNR